MGCERILMETVMAAEFIAADLVAKLLVNLWQDHCLITKKKSLLEELPLLNRLGFRPVKVTPAAMTDCQATQHGKESLNQGNYKLGQNGLSAPTCSCHRFYRDTGKN